MHIVFEEGVRLTWGGTPSEEPVVGRPEEGSTRPPAGGGNDARREGLSPGLSSGSFSEAGDTPQVGGASAASLAAAGSARNGQGGGSGQGLSLTRFLSNVVVACSQVGWLRAPLFVWFWFCPDLACTLLSSSCWFVVRFCC